MRAASRIGVRVRHGLIVLGGFTGVTTGSGGFSAYALPFTVSQTVRVQKIRWRPYSGTSPDTTTPWRSGIASAIGAGQAGITYIGGTPPTITGWAVPTADAPLATPVTLNSGTTYYAIAEATTAAIVRVGTATTPGLTGVVASAGTGGANSSSYDSGTGSWTTWPSRGSFELLG